MHYHARKGKKKNDAKKLGKIKEKNQFGKNFQLGSPTDLDLFIYSTANFQNVNRLF